MTAFIFEIELYLNLKTRYDYTKNRSDNYIGKIRTNEVKLHGAAPLMNFKSLHFEYYILAIKDEMTSCIFAHFFSPLRFTLYWITLQLATSLILVVKRFRSNCGFVSMAITSLQNDELARGPISALQTVRKAMRGCALVSL